MPVAFENDMSYLTTGQLLLELARRPGLIPVEVDAARSQVVWADLEGYHCYEGLFHKSLGRFAALKRAKHASTTVAGFVTHTDTLREPDVLRDYVYPTGFIFHAGRCGSTLLAKVLARDRTNLVVSEAAAHNQIWLAVTNDETEWPAATDENKSLYKHLLLATGRRRLPAYREYFVKFTSFNILFFDFIKSVFPDVPAIFIYREPAAILASFLRKPVEWLGPSQVKFRKLLFGTEVIEAVRRTALDVAAKSVRAFLAAGLRAGEQGAKFLNYNDLVADNLPMILSAFRFNATTEQVALMRTQFDYDSKVEHGAHKFTAAWRSEQERMVAVSEVSDELERLYESLARSEMNLTRSRFS